MASTFGHVAPRRDFFEQFFTGTAGKARFLRNILQHPCGGDPAFTFSDVGRALQCWLMQANQDQPLTTFTVEHVPAATHVNQTLLGEFKMAYRTKNVRPVRGCFFFPGKRADLACPIVALALHRAAVDRTDPDLASGDAANPAIEWAAQQLGEEWVVGVLDGFDRQQKRRDDREYHDGHDFGSALASEILPGEQVCGG